MPVSRRLRNAWRYWRLHGTRGFADELRRRLTTPSHAAVLLPPPAPPPGVVGAPPPAPPAADPAAPVPTARQLVVARFAHAVPLAVFRVPRAGQRRISIVTDSINQGSLFGGVGTAMILAALLAARRGARLRVVTRTERALPANLHTVLSLYGISLADEVEFAFPSIHAPQSAVDVFDDELFVTTSWWTTESTLAAVPGSRILYVLQEDERMFYPGGDDHLRCSRLLANENVHVAVNTQGLLDHLVASGLPHLARTARAFEPAFPAHVYSRRPRAEGRRRLMFYARPNHVRNLFYFGLEVLDSAVARGIVDPAKWELLLVGAHVPAFQLCDGTVAQRIEGLSWPDYAALAGTIDVGLCLMYTPHPSYPPLDLAASGAVVVTNRFGNKQSLEQYCANILSADLTVDSMLAALQQALQLAEDEPERQRRFEARRLQPDWAAALSDIVEHHAGAADAWA